MIPNYQPAQRAVPASMSFGQWVGVVIVAMLVAAVTAGVIVFLTMRQSQPAPWPDETWPEATNESDESFTISWWMEDRKPEAVIAREYTGDMSSGEAIGEFWGEFMGDINSLGVEYPDGPPIAGMSMMGENGEPTSYHACFRYDWQANGEVEGLANVTYVEIPGGRFAGTLHHGPYENMGESYEQLTGWLAEEGIEIDYSRPCVELYIDDPESTPADELTSELLIPIP